MTISNGNIRIESNYNIVPSNIELIGFNINGYIILKYNINDIIQYTPYYPEKKNNNIYFLK